MVVGLAPSAFDREEATCGPACTSQRPKRLEALAAACARLGAAAEADRIAAWDAIGDLCSGLPALGAQTWPAVAGALADERAADVLEAALQAVHLLGVEDSRDAVLRHAASPWTPVRLAVAQALPAVAGDPPAPAVVAALVRLTDDADDDVRDWATFGLGSSLTIDSIGIRGALWRRVDDEHGDTRAEAIVALRGAATSASCPHCWRRSPRRA